MKHADQALYEAKRHGRAAGWLSLADAGRAAAPPPMGRLIPFPGEPFPRQPKPADLVLPQARADAAVPGPRRVEETTQVTPRRFDTRLRRT